MGIPGLSDFTSEVPLDRHAQEVLHLLASGGDERIVLDPVTGLNRYHSGPYPRSVTAYASSTANDMSVAAFSRVMGLAAARLGTYADHLEQLRGRIRKAYQLPTGCRIVFAASGTDLEYVALAAIARQAPDGIHNILLGADEVGSGCRLSAHGMYFASTTALGVAATPGEYIAGLEQVELVDIPVRCEQGRPRGDEIAAEILAEISAARRAARRPLVHIVHGSKTGLILPEMPEVDQLLASEGEAISLVVDACQARVTSEALQAYLERGAIVLLTGSKFMGGPPFSGFALVPPQVAERAGPLPEGLADVFRGAEWPEDWPGRKRLADEDNPGLWLRLEAAIFELERFQALSRGEVTRVIGAFQDALTHELIEPLGLRRVTPYLPGCEHEASGHPIEMHTLATIDVSRLPGAGTFDEAQGLHRSLALSGLRLGQPVRSLRTPEGDWAGTLRIGLSMPQVVELSRLDDAALSARLAWEMEDVAGALSRETRRVAA